MAIEDVTPASPRGDKSGDGPLVVVLPDPETAARAVATAILVEARSALKRRGRFSIALAGGSTPRRTYELLSLPPFEEDMPWDSIDVFWGDERCVDPGDPRSNELVAREALLDRVTVPVTQVHPMRCPKPVGEGSAEQGDRPEAEAAAVEYERVLREYGSPMDLVLLGLGEDGHTASLFPGSETLDEQERWVVPARRDPEGQAADDGDASIWRVTLTPLFIGRATRVFFVVTGAAKAAAVRLALEGGTAADDTSSPVLPARLIRPSGGSPCWFIDEEAASQLKRTKQADARGGDADEESAPL